MDNSISLKKLQVVSGVLRKGNEGLGFFFSFFLFNFLKMGFFSVRRGGWVIPPLSKGGFKGLGEMIFLWDGD